MASDNYAVVIPARYESTRLPGKPLLKIAGREMVLRTWERIMQAVADPSKVFIATEDQRIKDVCTEAGAQVLMTSSQCLTGTDRLCEVAHQMPDLEFIVNVQGDEPIIDPEDIRTVISHARASPNVLWNGYAPVRDEREWRSRTIPKVVIGHDNKLLYMSRSPIPGNKHDTFENGWKQICIYSFPVQALAAFGRLGKKTDLEEIEDIEILRFVELGFDVKMLELSGGNLAVDTLDDLAAVEQHLRANNSDARIK